MPAYAAVQTFPADRAYHPRPVPQESRVNPVQLAFVFPGQGSQSLGMLGELASAHAEIRATFDEASAALS